MSRIHTNPQYNKERERKKRKKKKKNTRKQKHMFSLKDSPTACFCEVVGQKKNGNKNPKNVTHPYMALP